MISIACAILLLTVISGSRRRRKGTRRPRQDQVRPRHQVIPTPTRREDHQSRQEGAREEGLSQEGDAKEVDTFTSSLLRPSSFLYRQRSTSIRERAVS